MSAAADAEWVDLSASLTSDLLTIQDPGESAIAYADLAAKLGATEDRLLSADEARVRASFGQAPAVSAPQQNNQEHEREMAAWRARDTAARAEMDRLERARWLAAWVLAPAGVVLPVTVAAVAYGWGSLSLASVLPLLSAQPALVVMVGAVAAAAFCVFRASRARQPQQAWKAAGGAVAAGMALLIAARSVPVYVVGNGVSTNAGQSLAGVVVRVDPTATGARLEVLRGDGGIRRGEVLDFSGADPARFLRGR